MSNRKGFGVLVALWKVDNRKGYELAVCFSLLNSVSCARLDLLQLCNFHSTLVLVDNRPNLQFLLEIWNVRDMKKNVQFWGLSGTLKSRQP